MKQQLIINLRGTSGSGKSTLVRRVMDRYSNVAPCMDTAQPKRKRPIGYTCGRTGSRPLFVVGHYETPCGGAETVGPYGATFSLVREAFAEGYNVLFESVIVSTDFTWTYELHLELPLLVVGMDVPLEECVASVNERRRRKNPEAAAVNPKSTISKFNSTRSTMRRLKAAGAEAIWADRESAYTLICRRLGLTKAEAA